MRILALAFALALSGCAAPRAPADSLVSSHPTSGTCPEGAWADGDWWNETERDGSGRALGWRLRHVAGCYQEEGATRYVVEERTLRYGEPFDGPEETTVRNTTHDAPTTFPERDGAYALAASGRGRAPERVVPERHSPFAREGGCIDPDGPAPSRNVRVLPAWDASPEGIMVRLARALDDPLLGDPVYDGATGRLQWNTTGGSMESYLPSQPVGVTWRTSRDLLALEDPHAWMRELVRRYAGEDAERIAVYGGHAPVGETVHYGQVVGGRPVEAGGYVETAYRDMVWGAAYELPAAEAADVPEGTALATAKTYMRCALDAGGRTEAAGYAFDRDDGHPSFVVRNETLAYRFFLRYAEPGPPSHCGLAYLVFVDAAAGVSLGHETPLCA